MKDTTNTRATCMIVPDPHLARWEAKIPIVMLRVGLCLWGFLSVEKERLFEVVLPAVEELFMEDAILCLSDRMYNLL
tara:strand:- start:54 stop:284 length:231 start_codon:yes stop_codon:yes gene_type:complete